MSRHPNRDSPRGCQIDLALLRSSLLNIVFILIFPPPLVASINIIEDGTRIVLSLIYKLSYLSGWNKSANLEIYTVDVCKILNAD